MSKFKRLYLIETIAVFLLVLLWVYTAGSKLLAFREFRWEMYNQVFSKEIARLLTYLIPIVEMLAATLLCFSVTKRTGFKLSVGLMFTFTIYIGLALTGVYERLPCSCGGVLKEMGWQMHFLFNLFFTAVAATGLIAHYKRRRVVTTSDYG